jgi:7,8-dihydropterin-6-yl-methyl-4-(beta-D-ribofuranosyl)aminobenzene 5'-phosphate synthase
VTTDGNADPVFARFTVLCDNAAGAPGLTPAHGLAVLVEMGGRRVLFDTGPGATTLDNAAALGVSLEPLEAVVLSHGHYDHTGGLRAVLEAVGAVRVVANPGVFDETHAQDADGSLRYIGMPCSRGDYEALGAAFELLDLPLAVTVDLVTSGRVPPVRTACLKQTRLLRAGTHQAWPDDFRDDLSLLALADDWCAVLTGCAHAGLCNILYKAQTVAHGRPPRVVMGGMHLGGAPDECVAELAREAYSLGTRTLMPCHCTGPRAVEILQREFAGDVVPLATGAVVEIDHRGVARAMLDVTRDSLHQRGMCRQ